MKQCITAHYSPLIPPTQVKSKALLSDVLDAYLIECEDELPEEPFYIYFAPELTDQWCVGERIGDKISIRFKGKEVAVWYIAYVICVSFDNETHIISDTGDVNTDCVIVRDILLREVTTENINELFDRTEEEDRLIEEMTTWSEK